MAWRAAVALAMALGVPSLAAADEALPPELQDISILDKPGAALPKDVSLRDQDGRAVTLGSYLGDGKPVVLVLAYYRCPMLCSLVVNGVVEGLRGLDWDAGKDYRILVVSFDPRDSQQLARDKRENYLREYGRPVPAGGFEFLVGDEADVRRLADAVGFRYRWDAKAKEYAHAAGAFVIMPGGVLSRTLYGIAFPEKDLRLALVEASQGKLGSAWDQVVLFCFHYDAEARGYVLAARRLMKASGAVSVLLIGLFLWRLSKGRAAAAAEQGRAG